MFDRTDLRKRGLGDATDRFDEHERSRPEDRFISLKDELEQSFHRAGSAQTYEERSAWQKRFVYQGISILPKEERSLATTTLDFMKEEVKPFSPKVTPMIDDGQPIYEIDSTKCHLADFPREMKRLKEKHSEEEYNKVLPVAMEVATKLVEYGLVSWKLPFRGGRLGKWAEKENPPDAIRQRMLELAEREDTEGEREDV